MSAVLLWSQREYYKRMWNLRCEWNQRGVPYPLTITHHVTNTQILPLHTWIDKLTDLEWVAKSPPADPDFLLTETVCRQIGSYADLIVPLTRDLEKAAVYKEAHMGPESLVRMEWGMRMVHEIARWGYPFGSVASAEPARRLEKAVWDFGYGLPHCRVQNYWSDDAVLKCPSGVRWLALVCPKDRRLMLVLQSYQPKPLEAKLVLDVQRLGFAPSGTITDAEGAMMPPGAGVAFYDADALYHDDLCLLEKCRNLGVLPKLDLVYIRLHFAVRGDRLRPVEQSGVIQGQDLLDFASDQEPPRNARVKEAGPCAGRDFRSVPSRRLWLARSSRQSGPSL